MFGSYWNKTDIDVDIQATSTKKVTTDVNDTYLDEDVFDIDLSDCADIDQLLVTKGAIDFDPGNDISIENALNKALGGQGNDAGVALNNANQLSDADDAHDTYVKNDAPFTQNAYANGGNAYADDGFANGGNVSTWAGDDATVSGSASAAANAANDTDAFINSLVQGANVAANFVDTTVVGGGMLTDTVGEDDA